LIFSKLQGGYWPNVDLVANKCAGIVLDEANGRDVTSYLAGNSPTKGNDIGSPKNKTRKPVARDVSSTKQF